MAVNKVTINGQDVVDLTDATVTSDDLLTGVTAYGSTGEAVTGTLGDFSGSSHGLVPEAGTDDADKYLKSDGSWGAAENDSYMTKTDPTGTGAFSLNRKDSTTVGSYSFAEGFHTTAKGIACHAQGYTTTAGGNSVHVEGMSTTATGSSSHAEGHATTAAGRYSHAEGNYTTASGESQHVSGKYNIADTTSAVIIGNGTSDTARSNAFTLDWDGNAIFTGTVTANGVELSGTTEISDMTGATSEADGASGLVPKPSTGDQDKYLKGDGTWESPVDLDTIVTEYNNATDDTIIAYKENSTTIEIPEVMTGATADTAGASGTVPAPAAGDEDKVLCGAGIWKSIKNIFISTSEPTSDDGTDGDVWIIYSEE